jgi:hypothetical protein
MPPTNTQTDYHLLTLTNPFKWDEGGLIRHRGWKRSFDDPIPLPRGRRLVTLQDAGTYITKLPKSEHTTAEWQAAMEALILVATSGGPTMFARIGVMRRGRRKLARNR